MDPEQVAARRQLAQVAADRILREPQSGAQILGDDLPFTPEQIEEMYRRNPGWAAVEERLYGGLLSLR